MIILEGTDCNFKTTIAEMLSKELHIPVIKGSTFEQSKCSNEELFLNFTKILAQNDNVIIDRFIYSNLVYAYLYKDYSILNNGQVDILENMMRKKDAIVVYLYAGEEIIKSRMLARGDDYVKVDMIPAINNEYEIVMQHLCMDCLQFNTGAYSSKEIVKVILDYIGGIK